MTDRISLAEKYALMRPHLNERQWRLYLGIDALELGVPVVTQASGASKNTVRKGMGEVAARAEVTDRVRAIGAGRPDLETAQPGITRALESLVEPTVRGEPTSALKWTTKTLKHLREELRRSGFRASVSGIADLLKALGYRLQKTKKTKEGDQHPDRNAQFAYLNTLTGQALAAGYPVLSIDCKNKFRWRCGAAASVRHENPVRVGGFGSVGGVGLVAARSAVGCQARVVSSGQTSVYLGYLRVREQV